MDWVHCNVCYLQPGDKKGKKFELTSCGHIYCVECRKACVENKCKVCSSTCTTVELEANMRADVQQFFDDPGSALKKILRIIEFQEGHRQKLTSYRRMMSVKFQAAKAEIYKLRKKIEVLEKEIHALKQQYIAASTNSDSGFPRPSPPPVWNTTPRQHSTPHRKLSPLSPANSEGWVTPNRLTLKRTPSPSSHSLSQMAMGYGMNKQKKPQFSQNSSHKSNVYPQVHSSQQAHGSSSWGNFRTHRGLPPMPITPLTPTPLSSASRDAHGISPSPRRTPYNIHRGTTPLSSSSLLSNLKLTSPT